MIKLPENLIDKSESCWIWQGGKNSDGYGYYKRERVHRLVLSEKLGRPLKGMALHSCGNRLCCNPSHLREGTHKENMQDMSKHGTHDGKNRRGEKHPRSMLTDKQREEIRNSDERTSVLAKQYGVSAPCISMTRSGQRGS